MERYFLNAHFQEFILNVATVLFVGFVKIYHFVEKVRINGVSFFFALLEEGVLFLIFQL